MGLLDFLKPKASLPDFVPGWLRALMQQGDWNGVRWHTPQQIQDALKHPAPFDKPVMMIMSERSSATNQALWDAMVPVADGPPYTDRGSRTEPTRLYLNRRDPRELLFSLGASPPRADNKAFSKEANELLSAMISAHPPLWWVPAGQSRASVDSVISTYLFAGMPGQDKLPFQARMFLGTQASIGGDEGLTDVERGVERSPFTDMLLWGSAHATDPYPERVQLGQIPIDEVRRYFAKDPNGWPRSSIRTRYSRSIIQLIDWNYGGYFADLYFRPAPPAGWVEAYNEAAGTAFPPGTPVDVVGALSGLANIGAKEIRPQAEESTDRGERDGILQIVGFLEQAPSLR